MKHAKISNKKFISIFASVIIAICCIVVWFISANNAFASDANNEPTTEDRQNATVQISFDIEGVDSGVVTTFTLDEDESPKHDYNLGDKLTVEEGSTVVYDELYSNTASINIKDRSGLTSKYHFISYCPFGYEFANYSPETQPAPLTQNTDFKVVYKKSTKPYTIKGTARKTGRGQQPVIPDVNIKLSKPGQSKTLTTTTDINGEYKFENVPIEYLDGTLFASKDDLTDFYIVLLPEYYDPDHVCQINVNLSDRKDAEIQVNKPNEHHKYFDLRFTSIRKPDTILSDSIVSNETFFLDMEVPLSGDWVIGSDGSVTYKFDSPDTLSIIQIVPHGEEGYALSEWLQYKDNNEVLHFKPGQTITLGNEPLKIEPVYESYAPQPTPAEETKNTPQTGDTNNAVIPLAIIAAVCATALIARRKMNQK